MTNLTTKFVPQFSQLLSDASHLPLDPVTQLESQQVLEDKAFIDDYFAQKFPAFYTDLHRAYQQSARLGDALGIEVATRLADKFPGNPSIRAVSARVTANLLLQEHSYLATMATAASLAGRESEKNVASSALSDNAAAVSALFASTTGDVPTPLVGQWTVEHNALLGYAKGDSSARATLTQKFVNDFAPLAHVGKAYVLDHVNATLKVIDDQWKDHLLSMDHLKEGIALRGYGMLDLHRIALVFQKRISQSRVSRNSIGNLMEHRAR